MIVSVSDSEIVGHIRAALPECEDPPVVSTLGPGGAYPDEGFLDYGGPVRRLGRLYLSHGERTP